MSLPRQLLNRTGEQHEPIFTLPCHEMSIDCNVGYVCPTNSWFVCSSCSSRVSSLGKTKWPGSKFVQNAKHFMCNLKTCSVPHTVYVVWEKDRWLFLDLLSVNLNYLIVLRGWLFMRIAPIFTIWSIRFVCHTKNDKRKSNTVAQLSKECRELSKLCIS